MATETKNGGIAAALSCTATIEQLHRLHSWASGVASEPRELSREDRRALMRDFYWGSHVDPDTLRESIDEQAREWPLSVEYRCSGWQLSATACEPDEFRILISWGGPAVAVFGDISCSGYPVDPELKGQDWGVSWESVDCDSEALQWFCELFVFEGC